MQQCSASVADKSEEVQKNKPNVHLFRYQRADAEHYHAMGFHVRLASSPHLEYIAMDAFRRNLAADRVLDCLDFTSHWYQAIVLSATSSSVRIHCEHLHLTLDAMKRVQTWATAPIMTKTLTAAAPSLRRKQDHTARNMNLFFSQAQHPHCAVQMATNGQGVYSRHQ